MRKVAGGDADDGEIGVGIVADQVSIEAVAGGNSAAGESARKSIMAAETMARMWRIATG